MPTERSETKASRIEYSGSRPGPSRAARLATWLSWWVLLMSLWVAVDDSLRPDELLAGGVAAAVAALAAEVVSHQAVTRYRVRASWFAQGLRLPGQVAVDTFAVFPVSVYPAVAPDVTVASVITALCSVVGAVLFALAALYWRRLPVLRLVREHWDGRGLPVAVNRFQSGVLNDYITWLVTGVATLVGVLALIVRLPVAALTTG
jgi:hypothetical protein